MSIDIIGIASTHRIPIKMISDEQEKIDPNPNGSSRGKDVRSYSRFKAKSSSSYHSIDITYITYIKCLFKFYVVQLHLSYPFLLHYIRLHAVLQQPDLEEERDSVFGHSCVLSGGREGGIICYAMHMHMQCICFEKCEFWLDLGVRE